MELLHFDRATLAAGAGSAEPPAFAPGQCAAIAFTSGSTGTPQRYPKSWGGFVREAEQAGASLGLERARGGCILATVPPQHMYGFIASVILPLRFDRILHAERPFYPEDIRRALAAGPSPAILVTTPVQLRACVLERVALSGLDFILSSTAPLAPELAAEAERLFGVRVEEFYGSTETGAIARRRQAEGEVWRTFEEIRVSPLGDELQVQAPYLPQPMRLSDRTRVLGAREFLLLGRSADLIKIGGKRASLAELNRRLLAIEGVVDGVFFLPPVLPGREPRLAAFVVAPGLTSEQLLAALRERLDPAFLPRPLQLVVRLPRNTTGKLPRASLQRLLEEAGAP
jgi:acyl-coenzyme A synthetase/AMP-(fatty) acid ligase